MSMWSFHNGIVLQKKLNQWSLGERLLASRDKQNGEKPKNKRRQVSLDLLRELD